LHRPGARARAARLRPQYAVSGVCDARGDFLVIFGIAAAGRQKDDEGPLPFGDHLDARVAGGDEVARAFRGRQGETYSGPGRRRARIRKRSSTAFLTAIAP